MIKLITAYTEDRLIGKGDQLPWKIDEELNFFKNQTLGKIIVMGDTTFKGLPGPLPERKTIVLTLDKSWSYEHKDVEVIYSIEDFMEKYQNSDEEAFICGGATIYKLLLPFAKEIIISHIKGKYIGDVYFPEWDVTEYDKEVILEEKQFTAIKYTKK